MWFVCFFVLFFFIFFFCCILFFFFFNDTATTEIYTLSLHALFRSVDQFSGTSLAAQNLNDIKKAKIFVENGQTVIELDLNFDRAWSSVTKAMDASEILANDKDRSNGIFYVSYAEEEEGGFFSFLNFGRNNKNQKVNFDGAQFEVKITEKNNKTYVRAYSKDGKIEEAEELISKINESLS